MALDITNNILKTKMKNTVFKKGFQGKDTKPEEIARFRWLNWNNSQHILTAADLYQFMQNHPFCLMLPDEGSFLPDLVSALQGEVVFFSEYPRLAKIYEPVFDRFIADYVSTGLVFEYPLLHSTNVWIEKKQFKTLFGLKSKTFTPDAHAAEIVAFISEHGKQSKKQIRDHFKSNTFLFQRLDFYLYQLTGAMQLYKISFDQKEGHIYDLLIRFSSDLERLDSSENSLESFLENMIKSSLYVDPVALQRSLKKQFSKDEIMESLSLIENAQHIFRKKLNKKTILVHKETFNKINILS